MRAAIPPTISCTSEPPIPARPMAAASSFCAPALPKKVTRTPRRSDEKGRKDAYWRRLFERLLEAGMLVPLDDDTVTLLAPLSLPQSRYARRMLGGYGSYSAWEDASAGEKIVQIGRAVIESAPVERVFVAHMNVSADREEAAMASERGFTGDLSREIKRALKPFLPEEPHLVIAGGRTKEGRRHVHLIVALKDADLRDQAFDALFRVTGVPKTNPFARYALEFVSYDPQRGRPPEYLARNEAELADERDLGVTWTASNAARKAGRIQYEQTRPKVNALAELLLSGNDEVRPAEKR